MNIENLDSLPSPPGVAVKLLELFSAPEVTLDELNEVIGVDPTLTARIIKYANSPMFARRHEAQNLKQAITMLGANGVKMIALSFSLTEVRGETESAKFDFNKFWNASLATAICNQNIYGQTDQDKDEGFLIGLLCNIGQLGFYCSQPDKYETMMKECPVFDLQLLELEQQLFDANRYEVGAKVLEKWNFPKVIVNGLNKYATEESLASQSLKLANSMSYTILSESPDYDVVHTILNEFQSITGGDSDQAETFFAKTHQNFADIAHILSYECPEHKTIGDIEMEAKMRMVEMTLAMQQTNEKFAAENDHLKDMAYVDALTRLGNRRQYETIAEAELDRCSRVGNSFGLIVIDIDHFKKVNDTHGHAAGDAILVGVAKELELHVRKYDSVFRYGGEEFVVVLPETNLKICKTVAERLRESIESQTFSFEGTVIPITISLGGVIYHKGLAGDQLEGLFQLADDALYKAKKSGRNRYISHEETKTPMPNMPIGDVNTATTNSPTV